MRGFGQRKQMLVMAMHSAFRHQAHEMQPMTATVGERFLQNLIAREFTGRDRLIDTRKILINDPAGSEIQMADFGIAHLAGRKPNVESARA